MGVLVVGLAASTAFVVELVQLVVGLCERVMVVGWILKRLACPDGKQCVAGVYEVYLWAVSHRSHQ